MSGIPKVDIPNTIRPTTTMTIVNTDSEFRSAEELPTAEVDIPNVDKPNEISPIAGAPNVDKPNENNQTAGAPNVVKPNGNSPHAGAPNVDEPYKNAPRGFIPGVTLALTRYEYANLHHTLCDVYNTFLALLVLRLYPRDTTVLLVDAHPWGKLDALWGTLFGGRGVWRAAHLPAETRFELMVWIPVGYHSPLFIPELPSVPFLPELRQFIYQQYGVRPKPGPDCSMLHVLFVLRRDYLAHPRNPSGRVQRKIANEAEITHALRVTGYAVHDVQLDLLSVREQLRLVGETDIMLGMLGAGLTWSLLLYSGAGIVEITPFYFQKHSQCFKAIARWRGLHHVYWTNQNATNERADYHTYLPPDVVIGLINHARDKICGK